MPTLEVIRRLAIGLRVTADDLLFDEDERTTDCNLRVLFDAVSRLNQRERKVAREMLEGIFKHDAKRWVAAG